MRGLLIAVKMFRGKLGLVNTPQDAAEFQLMASILAEDQGIKDGLAGLNIPMSFIFDEELCSCWARGEEIGLARRAAGAGGLTNLAALQTFRMRKAI